MADLIYKPVKAVRLDDLDKMTRDRMAASIEIYKCTGAMSELIVTGATDQR